jgi:hypothetical protein
MTGVPFRNTASQTTSSQTDGRSKQSLPTHRPLSGFSPVHTHAYPSLSTLCQVAKRPFARPGGTPQHRVHTVNRFLTRMIFYAVVRLRLDTIGLRHSSAAPAQPRESQPSNFALVRTLDIISVRLAPFARHERRKHIYLWPTPVSPSVPANLSDLCRHGR